jgi:AhpD family alkylhydroperoxidase
MSRIQRLPIEEWDPELRAAVHLDAMLPFQRNGMEISAHAPHMAKAMGAFFAISKAGQTLPPRLIELVRLRIAFHNQCRSCMAMRYQSGIDDGVTEDLVCSLEKPMEAPDLTDAERAALAYADLFANNHLAIDDKVYDNLRKYFTEAEIVEFGMFVASFVGFGRLAATFDMVEELPTSFQDKSAKIGPWADTGVAVG